MRFVYCAQPYYYIYYQKLLSQKTKSLSTKTIVNYDFCLCFPENVSSRNCIISTIAEQQIVCSKELNKRKMKNVFSVQFTKLYPEGYIQYPILQSIDFSSIYMTKTNQTTDIPGNRFTCNKL